MIEQVLSVKARLMQHDTTVLALSRTLVVNRLTAATVYCACGCRLQKTIKTLAKARLTLKGHRRDTPKYAARYEQALLDNALVIAKRTTNPRPRKQRPHLRQP